MYVIIYPADYTKVMTRTPGSPTQQQYFNCMVVRRQSAQLLFNKADLNDICNVWSAIDLQYQKYWL